MERLKQAMYFWNDEILNVNVRDILKNLSTRECEGHPTLSHALYPYLKANSAYR